jgi:nitrate reductase cytochrome c-type subunit
MCNQTKQKETDNTPTQYAGAKAFISCHKEIYESHINTAHFNTSTTASIHTIKGSFDDGKNSYRFSPKTIVACQKSGDTLYQVAYVEGIEKIRQPFDIVFGYGKNAQSFAAWSKTKLVQLPLSYFTASNQWINSPGYPDKVVFNRVITSRCLECHATYAQVTTQEGLLENFNKNIILGIDCEKCHGAASEHIRFKTQNPDVKDEKYIINASTFSRQQKLDACALCHSGSMQNLQPAFSFKPGDDLKKFYAYNIVAADTRQLDVHGNQYGLLTLSKCFVQSQMTCGSCHDSHKNETEQLAVFSQRCMSCHLPENKDNFCKLHDIAQSVLKQNCIDCHMPQQKSAAIVFSDYETGKKTAAKMRTHFIKIYPEETKSIISLKKR